MKKLPLDFVLFDMIGTTIQDANDGKSLILDSFQQAFAKNGIKIPYEQLNEQRGKTKKVAIQNLLALQKTNATRSDKIYSDFMDLLSQNITSFQEIEGASAIFEQLKTANIKVGIGSGLPLPFMQQLMTYLKWDSSFFDYIGSSDELSAGRPNPIMIFDAIKQLNLPKNANILKIGDTLVDVQEGKNAQVYTAVVLTGTQPKALLKAANPDYIFDRVKDLKQIL